MQIADKKYCAAAGSLTFFLLCLRYLYYGFTYFPQLDDYIQYRLYSLSGGFFELARALNLFAARPISGSLDILLWSRFWGFLIVAVLLVSAVYAASAVILYRALSPKMPLNIAFFAAFALLPANIEGMYWLSASTRICGAMLFSALCAYFLSKWGRPEGRFYHAILSGLCCLLAYGFYEQAMPLCAALVFCVILLYRERLLKRAYIFLMPFLNAGIYFVFTGMFKGGGGLYASRGDIVLPFGKTGPWYREVLWPLISDQLKSVYLTGPFEIAKNGLIKGLSLLRENFNLLFLLALAALMVAVFFLARKETDRPAEKRWALLVFGVILFAVPAAPFLVQGNPWISMRALASSAFGVGLLGSFLFSFFKKSGRFVLPLLAAAATLAGAGELADYRETWFNDTAAVSAVAPVAAQYNGGQAIAVINMKPSYLKDAGFYYHEHIHGVTESDWAFTGALRALSENPGLPTVVPIAGGPVYEAYDRFDEFAAYYYLTEDFVLLPLVAKPLENRIEFYYNDRLYARADFGGDGTVVTVLGEEAGR